MQNKLQPYSVEQCGYTLWKTADVLVDGIDDWVVEFGFSETSKQANFLFRGEGVVALLHTRSADQPPPCHINDPDVVARAFGVYQKRNGDLELWYIGARRSHPLSNSEGGTRWGVFGIERAPDSHGKARWNISGGSSITRTKNRDRIQGSPNPYVFACLVRMSQGCTHVSQNPEMPCAQLFHSDYSHLTHPSTHVLFTAAGFIKSKFLDHYTWSGTEEDLIRIRDGVLARMAQGEPVVHSS